MKTHAKQIFRNTLLMTAASLLMRGVGVSFQVYVSNRAGAEAMGLFSLLSGVYGFALTLATSGIHLGVTRLVVDAIGEGHTERVKPTMRRATLYSLLFGLLASTLLLTLAAPIGRTWLKDTRTIPSLRLLAVTLPLISLASAWNGYFTAVRRPYKTAVVQVTEQAIKIGATMYLLTAFFSSNVESVCLMLVLGGALSEICSFIVQGILYLYDRKRHFPSHDKSTYDIGKKLLKITLPIAFAAYIRSALLTLQHILIPEGLRHSGTTHAAALVAYGSIQSMALPVILYPAALIYSFSGLLIPELAEAEIRSTNRHITYMISRVWSLSMVFALGVSGILICFSSEIGEALYPGTNAATYIRTLAPLIPIMYVDTATDAMMKGLGEQVYSMKINIADALISVLLVWLLIPRFGIGGYIFTIYFSELFNTVLSITHLLSITRPTIRLFKWVYKPLLSIVLATCIVRLLLFVFPLSFAAPLPSILLHVAMTLSIYLFLLRVTGAVDKEDVAWFRSLVR